MSRSTDTKALYQALRHIINEEQEQATSILRQIMLNKARQAHESMLRDGAPLLTEGWDDEIAAEEYFTEADLDDAEDDMAGSDLPAADPLADGDTADSTVDAAADELSDDLGTEDESMDDDSGLADEVSDIKAELDQLAADFERFMSELDADGDGDHDMSDHDMSDDSAASAGDDMEAPEMTDMEDGEDTSDVEMGDEDGMDAEMSDDEEEKKIDEEDDFDDITESVMAELEKVTASLSDGTEVGSSGKAVGGSKVSPLPATKKEPGSDALTLKPANHPSFDREAAPGTKVLPKRKFGPKGETVKAPANKEGSTLDGGSIKVNTTSPTSK